MTGQPRFTQFADPNKQAGVETVAPILKLKAGQVSSVAPGATAYAAIALMAQKRVGALAEQLADELVGIVTERDYARKVILQGKSSKETPVADIMSSPVLTVTPKHPIDECLRIVTDNRIRHLPVMEQDRVVGLVSIGDLVRSILS